MLGLWQRRAAAAPRPQEGEGRETGSLRGARGRGAPSSGEGAGSGRTPPPSPVWRKPCAGGPARQREVTWDPPACAGGGSGLCRRQAGHAARLWHRSSVLPTPTLPGERVPRQPVPMGRQQQLCRHLESCPRCLLPACACGTWLGMNVAKQGGSAPARSRRGKRHTRPCALSQGGPGRRRGTKAAAEQEGYERAPGRRVPSQLGPAQRCRGHGTARNRAGQPGSDGTDGHSSGLREPSVPELSPRCPHGGRLRPPPTPAPAVPRPRAGRRRVGGSR